jgi:hypothetical protein
MENKTYKIIKFIFGLYLIWLALYNINKISENEKLVQNTLLRFENGFSLDKIVSFLNLKEYIKDNHLNYIRKYSFNFEVIRNSSAEFVYLMNFSLILGGILCAFGFKISIGFSLIGILLNIILIHNIYYFQEEKIKVNVFKYASILGGILFI